MKSDVGIVLGVFRFEDFSFDILVLFLFVLIFVCFVLVFLYVVFNGMIRGWF